MALTDENNGGIGATMLVGPTGVGNYGYPMPYPMMGNYGGGNGLGGFGGDLGALIILFLFAAMFGGGFGGFGGFGMGGFGGGFGNMFEFPWLLNGQQQISNNTNNGFRDSMIQDNITSVRDGVGNLATQLCGCCGDIQMGIAGVNQNISSAASGIQNSLCQGFAGTTAAINGAQNALAQQLYTNQIADLERSYAAQTASTAGMNNIAMNLQNCCCENRAATADLKYTVATEACADRAAVSSALRDVLAANTASTQRILDQLCQDKIDAKNDTIAQLRSELLYARGQASQDVQTARILAGQVSETDAIYNRLSQCPVNTVPVYGNQPVFRCAGPVTGNNCGCGCNNGFAA